MLMPQDHLNICLSNAQFSRARRNNCLTLLAQISEGKLLDNAVAKTSATHSHHNKIHILIKVVHNLV